MSSFTNTFFFKCSVFVFKKNDENLIQKIRILANTKNLDEFVPIKWLYLKDKKTDTCTIPVRCCQSKLGDRCDFEINRFVKLQTPGLDIFVFIFVFILILAKDKK